MYKKSIKGWLKHLDFIILDSVALQLAFALACRIRTGTLPYSSELYRNLAIAYAAIDLVIPVVFRLFHNAIRRGYLKELFEAAKQALIVFLFATGYLFLLQIGYDYSRYVLLLTAALHTAISWVLRSFLTLYIRKHGVLFGRRENMLVVTEASYAEKVVSRLLKNKVEGYRVFGVILISNPNNLTEICSVPVVCDIDDASAYICREWIDSIYIECKKNYASIEKIMDDCQQMAVPVHFTVSSSERKGVRQIMEKVGGIQVVTAAVRFASPLELFVKRTMDIVGGLLGSIAAVILILIIGPIIKIASPGPVLYTSERIGENGKRFKFRKIRSMYMDADDRKKELMAQNRIKDGRMFKLDFDPRIIGNRILPDGTKKTGIGEFLRRTSIDEFPQFFNVLLGQMSLVGTRPPIPDEWEKYEFHHRARLACKPGITGLWQISGRSSITDFEEVVRLDTEYISNWSLGLDIKILWKTIGVVLRGRGAM